MIAETLKAWAAGILDGEGDIEIKTSGKGQLYFQVWVGITNSDGRIIDTIHDNWGGYMHTKGSKYLAEHGKQDGVYKTSYILYFSDKLEILKLLFDIKPYLVSKKDAAEIVLRAVIALPDAPEGKKRASGVSKVLKPFYDEYIELLKIEHPSKTQPRQVY